MSGHDDSRERLHDAFRSEVARVATNTYYRLSDTDRSYTATAALALDRGSDVEPDDQARHLAVRHVLRQIGYFPAPLPDELTAAYADVVAVLEGTGDLPTSSTPPPQAGRCSDSDDSSAEALSRSAAPLGG